MLSIRGRSLGVGTCVLTVCAAMAAMVVSIGLPVSDVVSTAWAGNVDDHIFDNGFEIDVPSGCAGGLDADGDGLLDPVCIVPFVPPDPELVAPTLDPTVITDFTKANEFLYRGSPVIQRGVAEGVIQRYRSAVLRGLVRDEAGVPLPGVLVRVLDHPEYGYTYTRADGLFDLMVNGGGRMTVDYQRVGYLRAQRSAEVPWRDWQWVEDAVLIGLDAQVTTLSLSAAAPSQFARGSKVGDSDGERQGTVIVPAGTEATMHLWGGDEVALPSIAFRATEYTVGEAGPERMPGELPPASGYTYAVELSADEALVANARQVEFTRPLAFYVENFLDFPVGGIVPAGSYDFRTASWIPENNGRIVELLSIAGGNAVLDVDGSGTAANQEQLDALGIDADELMQLAQLYAPGQTLWRTPIPHLTPWDCNWPFGPDPDDPLPPDEEPPPDEDDPPPDGDDPPAEDPPDDDDPPNDDPPSDDPTDEDPPCESGSFIDCANLRLGQSLPVAGTDFFLNYRSDRVPDAGRRPVGEFEHRIRIRATGDTVSTRLRHIQWQLVVLGRRIEADLDSGFVPNQVLSWTWDQQDAYGRTGWMGQMLIRSRLVHYFPARQYAPAEFEQAFGRFTGTGVTISGDQSRGLIGLSNPDRITRLRARGRFVSSSKSFWDAKGVGLGGWMLSAHHVLDPEGQILYRGDGSKVNVGSFQTHGIEQLSPIEGHFGFELQALADGSLVYLDRYECSSPQSVPSSGLGTDRDFCDLDLIPAEWVMRVNPDGSRQTIAHSCNGMDECENPLWMNSSSVGVVGDRIYFSAMRPSVLLPWGDMAPLVFEVVTDGEPTIVVNGADPENLCPALPLLAAQGRQLYVACTKTDDTSQILVLEPDGSVHLAAGGGATDDDDVPAFQARLGALSGMVLSSDGDLYLAEGLRVRRIDRAGFLRAVVGTGTFGSADDGTPAHQANLGWISSIALPQDGLLHLLESSGNGRVRELRADGRIYTRMGGGEQQLLDHSGRYVVARQTALDTSGRIVRYTDGSVVFHTGSGTWRLPSTSFRLGSDFESEFKIASVNGSELYEFDLAGRHLRTRHVLTGAIKYQFIYSTDGYLVEIRDGDGKSTLIERDSNGQPQSIVGPYGADTSVELNHAGYLSRLSSPAAQVWAMQYTSGGLLTRLEKPRGFAANYYWQLDGRLYVVDDAEGGYKELLITRWSDRRRERVSLRTAEGRSRSYLRDFTQGGGRQRWNTDGDGVSSSEFRSARAIHSQREKSGEVTQTTMTPDPRFGMQVPLPQRIVRRDREVAPNVHQITQFERNVVPIVEDADLGELEVFDTVTINGRVYTQDFEPITRRLQVDTPEGRPTSVTIDSQQRPLELITPGLAAVRYEYDPHGRLDRVRVGDGAEERTTRFEYDSRGYLARVVDPLGRSTELINDEVGRVQEQILSDQRSIVFAYDANGNVESIRPPGRPEHYFDYNRVDQVTAYTAPGGVASTYLYNKDRQPKEITMMGDRGVRFFYGPNSNSNRLRSLWLMQGTSLLGNYEYAYHANGQLRSVTAPVVDGIFPVAQMEWSGSLLQSVVSTHTPLSPLWPIGGMVEFGYDDNRWLRRVVVSGGQSGQPYATVQTNYAYDNDGLLKDISVDQGIPVPALTLSYSGLNGLLESSSQDRINDTWTYNPFAEPTQYVARFDTTPLYQASYERDKLGRITRKTETVLDITTVNDYDYDLAGRLDRVRRDAKLIADYTYDLNGNRVGLTTLGGSVSGTYDDQDRMVSYGDCTYVYRVSGELATRNCNSAQTHYEYDALGNLRSVTLPDGRELSYIIDGLNRRIGKQVDGIHVQGFLYVNQLRPVAELDGSGEIQAIFVYAERFNVPSFILKGGRTYRVISDQLGSPRLIVDTQSGNVAQRLDYDTFGRVLVDTNPGFQPFGFAGGLYDRDTGLVRFGARDYYPDAGRWTKRDTLAFIDAVNAYSFVQSDPINSIDPNGKSSIPVIAPRPIIRGTPRPDPLAQAIREGLNNPVRPATPKDPAKIARDLARDAGLPDPPVGRPGTIQPDSLPRAPPIREGMWNRIGNLLDELTDLFGTIPPATSLPDSSEEYRLSIEQELNCMMHPLLCQEWIEYDRMCDRVL